MLKKIFTAIFSIEIFLIGSFSGGCVQAQPETEIENVSENVSEQNSKNVSKKNLEVAEKKISKPEEKKSQKISPPPMVQKPIPQTPRREQLTREYAELHYGISETTIVPQAVVVHWTAGSTWESAYNTFLPETRSDGSGTVNVCSHYIIGKDGTIFCLTEETALNRHAIGYNWCSIGIENVGGVGNR